LFVLSSRGPPLRSSCTSSRPFAVHAYSPWSFRRTRSGLAVSVLSTRQNRGLMSVGTLVLRCKGSPFPIRLLIPSNGVSATYFVLYSSKSFLFLLRGFLPVPSAPRRFPAFKISEPPSRSSSPFFFSGTGDRQNSADLFFLAVFKNRYSFPFRLFL